MNESKTNEQADRQSKRPAHKHTQADGVISYTPRCGPTKELHHPDGRIEVVERWPSRKVKARR